MEMQLRVTEGWLKGEMTSPPHPRGVVLFAHGSGSSRFSPRNQAVAASLQARGMATLLMDLLTPTEARDTAKVFDSALLAKRLLSAVAWVREQPGLQRLPLGFFGASTGAAAALTAAAERPELVSAIVSRGGRPDLALQLPDVRAPTLLIVGGEDTVVIELNHRALAMLTCEKNLELVPGATHLFEEPGALEQVAALAGAWFAHYLHGGTSATHHSL